MSQAVQAQKSLFLASPQENEKGCPLVYLHFESRWVKWVTISRPPVKDLKLLEPKVKVSLLSHLYSLWGVALIREPSDLCSSLFSFQQMFLSVCAWDYCSKCMHGHNLVFSNANQLTFK